MHDTIRAHDGMWISSKSISIKVQQHSKQQYTR